MHFHQPTWDQNGDVVNYQNCVHLVADLNQNTELIESQILTKTINPMCDQSEMIMLEPVKEAIQAVVLGSLQLMIPKAHHLSIKNLQLFCVHDL